MLSHCHVTHDTGVSVLVSWHCRNTRPSNCDHFTYKSFKKYLRSKVLKTSCILSHPNADSSIWGKYCDLKICHLLKILEHCYMELEVNIQERKTAPRKVLSLGNGTTHCMQPPTTASQTCCLSPLFSYHCGQLWGIIRSQKQDIATILGHISYLLLLNTYIILSRMMSSDYRFVN